MDERDDDEDDDDNEDRPGRNNMIEEEDSVGRVIWGSESNSDLERMLFAVVDEGGSSGGRAGGGSLTGPAPDLPPTQITASTLALSLARPVPPAGRASAYPFTYTSGAETGSGLTRVSTSSSSLASTSTTTSTSTSTSEARSSVPSQVHLQRRPQRRNRSLPLSHYHPSPYSHTTGIGTGIANTAFAQSHHPRSTSSPYPLNLDQNQTSAGNDQLNAVASRSGSNVDSLGSSIHGGISTPGSGPSTPLRMRTIQITNPHTSLSSSSMSSSFTNAVTTPRAAKIDSLISLVEKRLTRSASRRSAAANVMASGDGRASERTAGYGSQPRRGDVYRSPGGMAHGFEMDVDQSRTMGRREIDQGPSPVEEGHGLDEAGMTGTGKVLMEAKTLGPPQALDRTLLRPQMKSPSRRGVLGMRPVGNVLAPQIRPGPSSTLAHKGETLTKKGGASLNDGATGLARSSLHGTFIGEHGASGDGSFNQTVMARRVRELTHGPGRGGESTMEAPLGGVARDARRTGRENDHTLGLAHGRGVELEILITRGASAGTVAAISSSARGQTQGGRHGIIRFLPTKATASDKSVRSARQEIPASRSLDDPMTGIGPTDATHQHYDAPEDTGAGNDSLESIDDGMDGLFSSGGDDVEAFLRELDAAKAR